MFTHVTMTSSLRTPSASMHYAGKMSNYPLPWSITMVNAKITKIAAQFSEIYEKTSGLFFRTRYKLATYSASVVKSNFGCIHPFMPRYRCLCVAVCLGQRRGWRTRRSTAATTATRRRSVRSARATRWSSCGRRATGACRSAGASRRRWATSAATATFSRSSTDDAPAGAAANCACPTPSWRARGRACENSSRTSRPPTAACRVRWSTR